jgi:hypothetical protein
VQDRIFINLEINQRLLRARGFHPVVLFMHASSLVLSLNIAGSMLCSRRSWLSPASQFPIRL